MRQLRLDTGLTRQDLAERANRSVEAIGTLERGSRTCPRRNTVALLARALGLHPSKSPCWKERSALPIRRTILHCLAHRVLQLVCPVRQTRRDFSSKRASFVARNWSARP